MGQAGKDPPLEASEGAWPCRQLDFTLVPYGTVRGQTSVVQSRPTSGSQLVRGKAEFESRKPAPTVHLALSQHGTPPQVGPQWCDQDLGTQLEGGTRGVISGS